jgi:hypothetical protein
MEVTRDERSGKAAFFNLAIIKTALTPPPAESGQPNYIFSRKSNVYQRS